MYGDFFRLGKPVNLLGALELQLLGKFVYFPSGQPARRLSITCTRSHGGKAVRRDAGGGFAAQDEQEKKCLRIEKILVHVCLVDKIN